MPIERQKQTGHRSQQAVAGFTLVELMVVVAVVGILAVVAAPSMSELLNANKAGAAAGELTASLQLARSEAIRRNARVTVCASTDGTTCASNTTWTRWIVHGLDNVSGADEVIRDDSPTGSVEITGPAAGVVFRPSGLVDSAEQLEVAMSDKKKCLAVLISGVVSMSSSACT